MNEYLGTVAWADESPSEPNVVVDTPSAKKHLAISLAFARRINRANIGELVTGKTRSRGPTVSVRVRARYR